MKKKAIAGKDSLVLFFIKYHGMAPLVESLSPEAVIRLLRKNVEECESIIHETGGTIFRVEGHCILAAWNERECKASNPAYNQIARTLIERLQESTCRITQKSSSPITVSISMTKGECVFERIGQDYTHVFGAPVTKVMQISKSYTEAEGNVVFVDESLKENWIEYSPEPVNGGVYKVKM